MSVVHCHFITLTHEIVYAYFKKKNNNFLKKQDMKTLHENFNIKTKAFCKAHALLQALR